MRRFFEFIISTKTLLITIYLFLAQKFLLRELFNSYRFSEQKYIYEYGILISKGLVYLAFVLSFLYPLIVWLKTRNDFRKNLVLVIIGFIPALYFIILYTLSSWPINYVCKRNLKKFQLTPSKTQLLRLTDFRDGKSARNLSRTKILRSKKNNNGW